MATPIFDDEEEKVVFDAIKFLIENGADVNVVSKYDGTTVLRLAVECNNIGMVKYLIEHGADPRLDKELLLNADIHNFEMINYLVEHGADVNAKNESDDTLLTIAIERKEYPLAKYLIEHGADVNAKK